MPEYAFYEFVHDWPELTVAINELEKRLRTTGRPVAADILLSAFGRLRDELLSLAKRMAVFGTEELRRQERQTRVRPDTEGGGGPRLETSLQSDILPQQDLLPGSVGIANEEVLDANVPWWITNEIGNSTNVGRKLFGYFYGADDEAAPSRAEFRDHPLFASGPGPVSGLGVIEEPIPARYFVAKAVPIINRLWQEGFHAAKSRFDADLSRALVTRR